MNDIDIRQAVESDCDTILEMLTRLLHQFIENAARHWKAAYLDLMVHGHNVAADRFYRRHGFEERSHDRHLTLDGETFQTLRQEF